MSTIAIQAPPVWMAFQLLYLLLFSAAYRWRQSNLFWTAALVLSVTDHFITGSLLPLTTVVAVLVVPYPVALFLVVFKLGPARRLRDSSGNPS